MFNLRYFEVLTPFVETRGWLFIFIIFAGVKTCLIKMFFTISDITCSRRPPLTFKTIFAASWSFDYFQDSQLCLTPIYYYAHTPRLLQFSWLLRSASAWRDLSLKIVGFFYFTMHHDGNSYNNRVYSLHFHNTFRVLYEKFTSDDVYMSSIARVSVAAFHNFAARFHRFSLEHYCLNAYRQTKETIGSLFMTLYCSCPTCLEDS